MSRKKQMGYYRYRDWSKLRSSSRSCESCVQGVGRREKKKTGRKKGVLFKKGVFGANVFSAYGREDGPLGTDSRQWVGIIWWMRLLQLPPLPSSTPPLHNHISCSLALFLSLRWSERGGIRHILYSCRLACVTAGPGDFGKKTGISLCSASLQRRSSSLSLCCSPCEGKL